MTKFGVYTFSIAIFSIAIYLTGCGGGSDSVSQPNPTEPDTSSPTPVTPAPTPPAPVEEEILPVVAPDDSQEFEGFIEVTFSVNVPDNTPPEDRLYITGDFEGWSGGGNSDYELILQNKNLYETTLSLDAGSTIQFKFTRGNWVQEESSDLGRFVGNRIRRLAGENVVLNETVEGWRDLIVNNGNPHSGYWNTPTPDYSENTDRPVVTLNGTHVVYLSIGDNYIEPGASAENSQGGDLTNAIEISGTVNTQIPGDNLLTYRVTDSQNNTSLGKTRIVRVVDSSPTSYTLRPVGESMSHLGYAEQLPAEYGQDPDKLYPLIIYHHGGRGDASSIDASPLSSLTQLFSLGGGTAALAMSGDWNTASPLIALSPQRSELSPVNMQRIDAFVDYAIHHYQVDPNRIYMTGHSQGGLVAWQYAVQYPEKVAAIAPLASGFFSGGVPNNVCDAAPVTVWAFHSIDDNVIRVGTGRAAVTAIEDCQPMTAPRFTTFDGLGHQSHQYVLSLQGMGNALSSDFPFEQNLYEWLMQQNISNR